MGKWVLSLAGYLGIVAYVEQEDWSVRVTSMYFGHSCLFTILHEGI